MNVNEFTHANTAHGLKNQMNKTPKEQWDDAKIEFLEKIKAIDGLVPWSEREPLWWINMQSCARYIRECDDE